MPSVPKIKIPFARRNGSLVHVSEVESGLHEDCLCVQCDRPLVAKKGTKQAHHFAHTSESDCSAETALHKLGKEILATRIREAIAAGDELPLFWECQKCGGHHQGDLVKKARDVVVERPLEDRIPDITLFGSDGSPCAVVEVVVTHEPELGARQHYRERRVHVVEFHLKSGDDLIRLRKEPELDADHVSYCPVPEWKLRIVMFSGTPLRLDEVDLELIGSVLHVRGRGDPAPNGSFHFDTPADAEAALAGIKAGTVTGLYDPQDLEGVVRPSDIVNMKIAFRRLRLKEYFWDFCGIRRIHWQRGRGRIRRRW